MDKNINISTTGTPNTNRNPSGATTTQSTPNKTTKQAEMKIGKCTYIINTSFNGDKSRSICTSLVRIISRDASSGKGIPNITT